MTESVKKPKLLFFQWDHRPNRGLSDYLLLHMNDHVRCLAQHFDVTVVNQDCDYGEMLDRHEPDMALFESGYQTFVSRRPTITNVRGNDSIPKAGLHNADSWSDCRGGFLSDMEHWGIDSFFSICTTTAEYLPAAKDRLYVWPNFVDPAVFRDYGLEKTVPVMLSGKSHEQYPWRQEVFPLVSRMLPCLILPQFDHASGLAHRTLAGEGYARALNASRIALTCGTMAREVVRKHFEIPGAGCCLVCEESEGLAAAGFVHMQNCAIVDGSDVLDVVDHLLGNPDELARITRAGHDLVHARHTLAHRPQIYQWFELQGRLALGQEIAQLGPFGDLVARPAPRAAESLVPSHRGLDRAELREAGEALAAGEIARAREAYGRALAYVRYLPEASFGLARCDLVSGDAASARSRLGGLIESATVDYGAADPDPVEWAWFLLAVAAEGRPQRAKALARHFPELRHREIRRTLALLDGLVGGSGGGDDLEGDVAGDRPSLHALPEESFAAWRTRMAVAFAANGQGELAAKIDTARGPTSAGRRAVPEPARVARDLAYGAIAAVLSVPGLAALRPNLPPTAEFRYLRHLRLKLKRQMVAAPLGARLQARWRRRRARAELLGARSSLQAERN